MVTKAYLLLLGFQFLVLSCVIGFR